MYKMQVIAAGRREGRAKRTSKTKKRSKQDKSNLFIPNFVQGICIMNYSTGLCTHGNYKADGPRRIVCSYTNVHRIQIVKKLKHNTYSSC